MANERKRLEAMSELFESEKTYLTDMNIWATTFRRFFLNCKHISPQRRYVLNNIIFLNSDNIINLHTTILEEMAQRNEKCRIKNNIHVEDINQELDIKNIEKEGDNIFNDLEYTDIYENMMHQFEIYRFYIERLPKVEFIIDKELATNHGFAKELKEFLNTTGFVVMGYKHFVFRPSQKIARYPLLFNAIAKNSANETVKERIKRINSFLQEKIKEYDKVLGEVNNAFAMYRLLNTIFYNDYITYKMALCLFLSKRKLIQISNDVYIRSKYRSEPKPFRIYLLDHLILIVDVVTKVFGEDLYISDDPIPLVKYKLIDAFDDGISQVYFKEKHKFMMKEIDGERETVFYFKTETQCIELKNEILNITQKLLNLYSPEIQFKKYGEISNCQVSSVISTDPYFLGNSFSEEEEERIKRYYSEHMRDGNDDQDPNILRENVMEHKLFYIAPENEVNEEKNGDHEITILDKNQSYILDERDTIEEENESKNFIKIDSKKARDYSVLKCTRKLFSSIFIDKESNNFIFFTLEDGIYMKLKNRTRKIYHRHVKNVRYINEFKILVFIDETSCYWSQVTKDTVILECNIICNKADMFWYGKTLKKPYIAIRLNTNTIASFIHLYEINTDGGETRFKIITQLYIGAEISHIVFFTSKLIVCCTDFEVVDMFTLNTHSLINPADLTIQTYMKFLDPTEAKNIFKIGRGKYLICNNKVGFFVNQFGSTSEEVAFFAWYDLPTEFLVFDDYLIVITKVNVIVYHLYSSDILAYFLKRDMRFLRCCSGVWLHDNHFLYELVLPSIKNNNIE